MDRRIEGLPIVSASKIKTYKTCARQYQHKYITAYNDRPEDHKNVAALLGTALHKAIELKYREGKSPTGVFQDVMASTIEQWETEGLTIKAADYYPRAIKVGKDILTKFPWDTYNPQELELKFTLPFPTHNPLVNITGVIDMIDMSGMVIDHKSSTYAPNQDELDNDPQFIIYYWAYEQIYGVKPYKTVWNHLRTNRPYYADIEKNYDLKLEQLQLDITGMLLNPIYPRRQIDNVCRTKCSFYSLCYGDNNVVNEDEE